MDQLRPARLCRRRLRRSCALAAGRRNPPPHPELSLTTDAVVTIVAVLGTTITPYCFFWQSSAGSRGRAASIPTHKNCSTPRAGPGRDFAACVSIPGRHGLLQPDQLFIIVTTAATLQRARRHRHPDLAQAAEALRPIAGIFTFALFAAGIIGIGLLAVPVLAGSGAYASARRWAGPPGWTASRSMPRPFTPPSRSPR
jgi:Mn2+/Fe2+ NRAMP family transporter